MESVRNKNLEIGLTVSIYFIDIAISAAKDIYDEQLTLLKINYEQINSLELKILKLHTAKLYDLSKIHQFRQQIDQDEGEIVEILARTTMQNCMRKNYSCKNSSREVDVFLRLSLDLVEKQFEHCREVQFKVVVEES